MTITKARETISSISARIILTPAEKEALSLADQALKTIQDMKLKGASLYGTQCTL